MAATPHGLPYLYKYRDIKVAKLILTNRTIRISHPASFNDLLDGQITLAMPRIDGTFKDKLAEEYLRLAYLPELPALVPEKLGTRIVLAFRQFAASKPRDELAPMLRRHLDKLTDRPELEHEAGEILRGSGDAALILSLSANPASLPMWYHYADKYRGVVIVFDCQSDPQTMFGVATKVDYADRVPEVCSQDEWIRVMTGQQEHPKDVTGKLYLTKSKQWAYEEEYRLLAGTGPRGSTKDLPLVSEELGGVILGPETADSDADSIVAMARAWRPDCKIWKAQVDYRQFGFSITEAR